MIKSEIKKVAKAILQQKREIFFNVRKALQPLLGHQTSAPLMQIYRNDSEFHTVISLNHFVEFFSNKSDLDISFTIDFYSQLGKKIQTISKEIYGKGSLQINIADEIKGLDRFGIFSVKFQTKPRFTREIDYLGKLSPQFMTLFVPKDTVSAPQMVHSHKVLQGLIPIKTLHNRASGHIENLENISILQIVTPNSSSSSVIHKVKIYDAETGALLQNYVTNIPGYGVNLFEVDVKSLSKVKPIKTISYAYEYDLNLDHKKPIVFRKYNSGTWSANHT